MPRGIGYGGLSGAVPPHLRARASAAHRRSATNHMGMLRSRRPVNPSVGGISLLGGGPRVGTPLGMGRLAAAGRASGDTYARGGLVVPRPRVGSRPRGARPGMTWRGPAPGRGRGALARNAREVSRFLKDRSIKPRHIGLGMAGLGVAASVARSTGRPVDKTVGRPTGMYQY